MIACRIIFIGRAGRTPKRNMENTRGLGMDLTLGSQGHQGFSSGLVEQLTAGEEPLLPLQFSSEAAASRANAASASLQPRERIKASAILQ
jgi:hypothetical protein